MSTDKEAADTALKDQREAGVRDFASMTVVYYKTLREQGIGRGEAMQLACEWISNMMAGFLRESGSNDDE